MTELFAENEDIWLIAESGYKYRPANTHQWVTLVDMNKNLWMSSVVKLLGVYVHNIDGAFIETREASVIFSYKNV